MKKKKERSKGNSPTQYRAETKVAIMAFFGVVIRSQGVEPFNYPKSAKNEIGVHT